MRLVFSPSLVSISPPKLSRTMVLPTATLLLVTDEPLAFAEEEDLTELAFLGAGGCAAGPGASFRLRSSTIFAITDSMGGGGHDGSKEGKGEGR